MPVFGQYPQQQKAPSSDGRGFCREVDSLNWLIGLAAETNLCRSLAQFVQQHPTPSIDSAFGYTHGRAYLCGLCRALDSKKRWFPLGKGTTPVRWTMYGAGRKKQKGTEYPAGYSGREKGGRYGHRKNCVKKPAV